jgi:Zn-dependent peptidase ImmA (M78 family)
MDDRPGPIEEARKALRSFREADPTAPDLPIDPVRIARTIGINVYSAKLSSTLSGLVTRLTPRGGTDMYLNSAEAPVRQRFTAAHELGHYFAVEASEDGAERVFVHRRDQFASCGTDPEEVFANQFAAELITPEADVIRLHRSGLGPLELAQRFNVSLDSMNIRMKDLGLA